MAVPAHDHERVHKHTNEVDMQTTSGTQSEPGPESNVDADPSSREEPTLVRKILDYVVVIAAAAVIAFILRAFVFEVYLVPTGSMLPTIQLQDRLIGEKISYHFTEPKQGDIVTFFSPEDGKTTLVKRVIATGGQTVDLKDGAVYVDGQKLDEPYTHGEPSEPLEMQLVDVSFPYTVPVGSIWVMGDNRTNSLDSRYFGAVPLSSVTSRCVYIFWPISDASSL